MKSSRIVCLISELGWLAIKKKGFPFFARTSSKFPSAFGIWHAPAVAYVSPAAPKLVMHALYYYRKFTLGGITSIIVLCRLSSVQSSLFIWGTTSTRRQTNLGRDEELDEKECRRYLLFDWFRVLEAEASSSKRLPAALCKESFYFWRLVLLQWESVSTKRDLYKEREKMIPIKKPGWPKALLVAVLVVFGWRRRHPSGTWKSV